MRQVSAPSTRRTRTEPNNAIVGRESPATGGVTVAVGVPLPPVKGKTLIVGVGVAVGLTINCADAGDTAKVKRKVNKATPIIKEAILEAINLFVKTSIIYSSKKKNLCQAPNLGSFSAC